MPNDFKSRLEQSIRQSGPPEKTEPARIISIFRRYRRFAAAAILIGAAVWAWRWFQTTPGGPTSINQPVTKSNDILPGSNKAILTLSNGLTITLDSAANGAIGKQGNSTITNTGNLLTYQSSHSPFNTDHYLDHDVSSNRLDEPPSSVSQYNTLTTPRGGQYQLQLPDGTKVWLDAASSIRYPVFFTGAERRVEISGQAYLEVVHDPIHPFTVQAGGQTIRDIGTAFNISAYPEDPATTTTLVEGSIAVEQNNQSIKLRPGQQAQSMAGKVKILNDADIDAALAWKNGLFQFNNAGMGEIMRQAARWYDVDIQYEGGGAPDEHFSGRVPRSANASQLLKVLELTKSVRFVIEGKKIIVKPYK